MPISYVTAASLDGTQNGSAPIYGARAWVNFNGTGTVAISASGNVSSITDNGTGDYTVNFTTAMSDANFAASGMNGAVTTGSRVIHEYSRTSSTFRVLCTNGAGAVGDYTSVSVSIFR
jgi:hypothetical protein